MSSWFDRLLEELEQRQREADARREGRPLPPRQPRHPRDVTPRERGRRTNGDGDGDGGGGDGGRWTFPPVAEGTPWRRWLLIGGVVLALLFVLGLLGGVINLITDLMWYEALGRRDVLTTRLWSQVGLFVAGWAAFALPAMLSIWVAGGRAY
jgi:hypothetical protein